jgi:hypothetical protein
LFINSNAGDYDINFSDNQHIEDIIQSFNGDWKQFPMVGVGVSSYLASTGQQQQLTREILIQLKADGFTVDNPIVKIVNGNITVNPNAYRQ